MREREGWTLTEIAVWGRPTTSCPVSTGKPAIQNQPGRLYLSLNGLLVCLSYPITKRLINVPCLGPESDLVDISKVWKIHTKI